ncbi:MAG: glucokinase [Psychrobium sp.]|nr:glucokinase [Psychrobium sp.]
MAESLQNINLVADVGGTNIRLALIYDHKASHKKTEHVECFKCADFTSLQSVVKHYLSDKKLTINAACFAIAGPVVGETLTMTNLGWSFSVASLKQALDIDTVHFINDYTAIAMSLPQLSGAQLIEIHAGEVDEKAPRIICGPGTGLGLAQLINVNGRFECISGEGGHVEFSPVNARQCQLLENLMAKFEHVSVERLLSGQGIVNIYQSLAFIDGLDAQSYDASQISQGFINRSDPLCIETIELFYQILANFLGNMVLFSGAFGGVYIGGGIMPRLIEYIDKELFIKAYSHKGRFSDYVLKAPIYLITESQPGLIGAAVYLQQILVQSSEKETIDE